MKSWEFTSQDIKSVNKTIFALAYMNQGRELKLGEFNCKIGETDTDGIQLMYLVDRDQDEWCGFMGGIDINAFSSWCSKLTNDEIALMKANMGLQSYKDSVKRKRT